MLINNPGTPNPILSDIDRFTMIFKNASLNEVFQIAGNKPPHLKGKK